MTLKDWIKKSGKSLAEIAAEANTSQASLSRVARGKQKASADLASRIVALTRGKVTYNDIYGAIP